MRCRYTWPGGHAQPGPAGTASRIRRLAFIAHRLPAHHARAGGNASISSNASSANQTTGRPQGASPRLTSSRASLGRRWFRAAGSRLVEAVAACARGATSGRRCTDLLGVPTGGDDEGLAGTLTAGRRRRRPRPTRARPWGSRRWLATSTRIGWLPSASAVSGGRRRGARRLGEEALQRRPRSWGRRSGRAGDQAPMASWIGV